MGIVSNAMQKQKKDGAAPIGKPPAASPPASQAPPANRETPSSAVVTETVAAPAAVAVAPGSIDEHPNYSPTLVAFHDRTGRITEQYRALRARLLAKYGEKAFCLMVTSAESGEGKTVTCLNLGLVLAGQQERKIVVVDCDLRRRRIAAMMHMKNSPGMTELLAGTATLGEVLRPTAHPNLTVIPAGAAREDAGELVTRPELGEIISQLRRQYDTVLIDAPPVNAVSDVGILGPAAGEALMVVRMNHTRRETVDKAIHLLEAVNVKIIGMVLTHQKYFIPNYLYRYS